MRSIEAQAAALSAMLAAATAAEPRRTKTSTGVRIEATLPETVKPVTRGAILTALSIADRYGHAHTGDGDTVWAELDRKATS